MAVRHRARTGHGHHRHPGTVPVPAAGNWTRKPLAVLAQRGKQAEDGPAGRAQPCGEGLQRADERGARGGQ